MDCIIIYIITTFIVFLFIVFGINIARREKSHIGSLGLTCDAFWFTERTGEN
jgi:hypothetical protein